MSLLPDFFPQRIMSHCRVRSFAGLEDGFKRERFKGEMRGEALELFGPPGK